jgi:Fur family transcriptional regulator, ferric uptake regulator
MFSETHQRLIERLRLKGLRITPQREMILNAFIDGMQDNNHVHLTAEQILERVHVHSPTVNIATIYRTLDTLREYDILTVTALPGGPLEWELAEDIQHHHLVCEKCHSVTQIPDELIQSLTKRLLDEHGFHANLKHLALTGLCDYCATHV